MLCLSSLVLGAHREIFFPNLDAGLDLLTFSSIAVRFLRANNYEPVEVTSEDEARGRAGELIAQGKWPCYFFTSDTPGEKPFEEFYSGDDAVTFKRFRDMGVISAPVATGEVLQKCRLDANEPMPFACPEGCLFFEPRHISGVGWRPEE